MVLAKLASPGVAVQERDFTRGGIDPSFLNFGAICGVFEKGPIDIPTLVTTEAEFIDIFGTPNDNNFEYWYSVSNFLEYGGVCYVVRILDASQLNAVTDAQTGELVKSFEHWEDTVSQGAGTYKFISRTAGKLGNSLGVAVIDYGADQRLTLDADTYTFAKGDALASLVEIVMSDVTGLAAADELFVGATKVATITSVSAQTKTVRARLEAGQSIAVGDALAESSGGATVGTASAVQVFTLYVYNWDTATKALDVISDNFPAYKVAVGDTFLDTAGTPAVATVAGIADWYDLQEVYADKKWYEVAGKPGTSSYGLDKYVKYDEMHIAVYDVDGGITGTSGTILETFLNVSKISGAKTPQGGTNYFIDVVQAKSEYVYPKSTSYTVTDISGLIATPGSGTDTNGQIGSSDFGTASATPRYDLIGSVGLTFANGADDQSPSVGELLTAYEQLEDTEAFDIDFIIQGPGGGTRLDAITHAKKIISICEARKDCMGFISPFRGTVVGVSSAATQVANVVDFFNQLGSSSYVVFDRGTSTCMTASMTSIAMYLATVMLLVCA